MKSYEGKMKKYMGNMKIRPLYMGLGTWKNFELILSSRGGWEGDSQFPGLGVPQRKDMKHVNTGNKSFCDLMFANFSACIYKTVQCTNLSLVFADDQHSGLHILPDRFYTVFYYSKICTERR